MALLTSTPLSGQEILRAKMIGPVWGLRLVAYLLFLLWARRPGRRGRSTRSA